MVSSALTVSVSTWAQSLRLGVIPLDTDYRAPATNRKPPEQPDLDLIYGALISVMHDGTVRR